MKSAIQNYATWNAPLRVTVKRFGLFACAALLVACGGGGGGGSGAPVTPPANNPSNLAPTNVKLLEVSSMAVGQLSASWLQASDDATAATNLIYELHASTQAGFTPAAATQVFSGRGVSSANLTSGLVSGAKYYLKLIVKDELGASSSSDALEATIASINATLQPAANVFDLSAQPNIVVSANQVVLRSGIAAPALGAILVSDQANDGKGFLRKVTSVSTAGGLTTMQTAPASLNEVYSDLKISSSFRLDAVPQEITRTLAQSGLQKLSRANKPSETYLDWAQSGFSYSMVSAENAKGLNQPSAVQSDGFRATSETSKSGSYGKIAGESRIEINSGKQGAINLSLDIIKNNNKNVAICKVVVGAVTGGGHDGQLSLVQVSGQALSSVANPAGNRIVSARQPVSISASAGADAAEPYRVKVKAYFDDAVDNCSGDDAFAVWTETVDFELEIIVTNNNFPSQEQTNAEFSGSGSFNVRNAIVTTFAPEMQFDREIAAGKLQSAKMIVKANPVIEQTLTIQAAGVGAMDATRSVIAPRKFRKVYVTPAGIPIVISGEFKVDMRIQGNASGALSATEKLTIGYDEVSFGLEYRNGAFVPIQSAKPVYKLRIAGNGRAEADLTITLLPSLELTAYEVLTGQAVLGPYLKAAAGIEGLVSLDAQVDFEAEKLRTAVDGDYRLTQTRLAAGANAYLYADLSVFDYELLKYPSSATKGEIDTYQTVALIAETTLMDLPALAATAAELPGNGNAEIYPGDTRAIKILGTATNVVNPLYASFPQLLPSSFINWQAWTDAKIVDQISIDKSTYAVLPDPQGRDGVFWVRFKQPGDYTVRVGGYSDWGPWARQYTEVSISAGDANGNTIPDWWEQRYGLNGTGAEDTDGDGKTNLQEWQQGCSPVIVDPQCGQAVVFPFVFQAAPGFIASIGQTIMLSVVTSFNQAVEVVWSWGNGLYTYTAGIVAGVSNAFNFSSNTAGDEVVTATILDANGDVITSGSTVLRIMPLATITQVINNNVSPAVSIPEQGNTTDTTPSLAGLVSQPLSNFYSLRFYANNAEMFGDVQINNGISWLFTPTAAMSAGAVSLTVRVARFDGVESNPSPAWRINVTASTPPQISVTGRIPASGITASQCYQTGSNDLYPCSDAASLALNPQQDGHRAASNAMSYSTVGSYPVTSCVKDNITGLIWEGKEASGPRGGSGLYTNYDSTTLAQFYNGSTYINPTLAQINTATNSMGYVNYVNSIALCGHADWRLPTVDELHSIVDYGGISLAVNTQWFPNTLSNSFYWSSSPYVGVSGGAWYVLFSYGNFNLSNRNFNSAVRLVRVSQ